MGDLQNISGITLLSSGQNPD